MSPLLVLLAHRTRSTLFFSQREKHVRGYASFVFYCRKIRTYFSTREQQYDTRIENHEHILYILTYFILA